MTIDKLPPGSKDKLRAYCKLDGHEWTREWQLPHNNQLLMYKLCLRCSTYIIDDIIANAKHRLQQVFGVASANWKSKSAQDTGTLREGIETIINNEILQNTDYNIKFVNNEEHD